MEQKIILLYTQRESRFVRARKKSQIFLLTVLILGISFSFTIRITETVTNTFSLTRLQISRSGHILAFDLESQNIFLFGGYDGENFLDDTWFYDFTNNIWTQMSLELKPSARWTHVMVYDCSNKKMILFGGYNESGCLGDTWVFDLTNNSWKEMKPENNPSPRHTHTMAYDPDNQKVILFGENSRGVQQRDMWTYDYQNNQWEQIIPDLNPPSKSIHTMSFDSDNRKIILFGGYGPHDSITDDTWAYDIKNNTWEEMSPMSKPDTRYGHTMVYDANNKKTVLFGGSNNDGPMDDTWVYDLPSDNWIKMDPINRPDPRYLHSMVYHPDNRCIILFGGMKDDGVYLNDLWVYNSGTSTNTWTEIGNNKVHSTSGVDWMSTLLAGMVIFLMKKKTGISSVNKRK